MFRKLGQSIFEASDRAYKVALLDAVPQVDGTMLDVGCDQGAWTEQVRLRAGMAPDHVSGIEIVDDRRADAQARGFDVVAADIEQRWPYEDQSFQLVHANQVIEHIKRLDHFASETQRVLKPGGYAVICTENLASWHNVLALMFGWQPFSSTNISSTGPLGNPLAMHDEAVAHGESWQHIHIVSLRALVDLFTAHGFTVEQRFAGGYYPLVGGPAQFMARVNPGHAHFIGLRARRL